MSKLRSVSTAFWSDPFIEELTPSEKLLFLYFITNEKTNMLGIYEVSIKKISFDTGLEKEVIENALKGFERLSKVKYYNNHIVLINFMKHQNFNPNMKKSAIDVYNSLPNMLKIKDIVISKEEYLKGFERLLNHYGMVPKVEYNIIEEEVEEESELEIKNNNDKFFDELIISENWIESTSMQSSKKFTIIEVKEKLKEFTIFCNLAFDIKPNKNEFAGHFLRWLNTRDKQNKNSNEKLQQLTATIRANNPNI